MNASTWLDFDNSPAPRSPKIMSIPVDIAQFIGDGGFPAAITSVNVAAPVLQSSRLFGSHHTYPVITNMGSTINRRYSEFEWLYNTLSTAFPGIFIPPIPPKKMFGNQGEAFIELQRRPSLERFLQRCAQIPIIAESSAYQAFVCRETTFDTAQKDITKRLAQRTPEQLFGLYDYYFADITCHDVPISIDDDLDSLLSYLKIKEKESTDLASAAHDLHAAVLKQAKTLEKMMLLIDATNKTDEQHLQFICNNPTKKAPTVHFSFQCWSQYLSELEPSYNNNLFLNYVYEMEDITAFISLLNDRKNAKSKSIKSQQKVNAWDSQQIATEKQRTQRNMDIQQSEYDAKLLTYYSKLIWFGEWPVFLMKYVDEFNGLIKNFASTQASFATSTYHEWTSLAGSAGEHSLTALQAKHEETQDATDFLNDDSKDATPPEYTSPE